MIGPLATTLLSNFLSMLGVYAFVALLVLLGLFGALYRRMLSNATFDDLDSSAREEKTNCPSCGARSPVESDVCDYCENPLSGDETPAYGWADE